MTLKFLVVDDEKDTQQLLTRWFRREIKSQEYEFEFAFDGDEALKLLQEDHQCDIALIDINMPRMNGLELLDELRKNSYVMKFIVLSGNDDMENIRTAMNCGAFDFVPKPINFDDLIETINKSAEELKYLKERIRRRNEVENERKVYERELDIGRKIQGGFLPQETPKIEGWHLNTYFQSARQVAGDFFDVFSINGHSRIGLIVADVCDKGVGAALFMTLFRSMLRSTAKFHEYADIPDERRALYVEHPEMLLKRCVHFTNNYVANTHGHTSMFASLFFAFLEPETGHMYYINAGHEGPLISNSGKSIKELETTGPVVGLFPDAEYKVQEITLEKGDTLVAYTDGVTDVLNEKEEPFTKERLLDLLLSESEGNLTQKIVSEIQDHMGNATQFDDVTIMALTRRRD